MQQKAQIPNTRSELESTRPMLVAACAPAEHVHYVDKCLLEEKKQ